jgi:hypothetical protein
MKKLLMLLLCVQFFICANSQINYKVNVKSIPIRVIPGGNIAILVTKNNYLSVLYYDVVSKSYICEYENIKGYVDTLWLYNIDKSMKIKAEENYKLLSEEEKYKQDSIYKKMKNMYQPVIIHQKDIFDITLEKYGRPDEVSQYTSGDYITKTWTYDCIYGKYRSIDFKLENGKWIKYSEFESTCN